MDFKKSLKDVVVLVVICAVFATILAAVNSVTAPIIAERLEGAANQAYEAVMPGATGFEDVDLSSYTLPATVVEAKREKSGMGYAVKLETKGYGPGMILIIGVDANGVVTGATCITSSETNGVEKTYGDNFVGKNLADSAAVDTVGGSTLTSQAYKSAVSDAINTATILGGGSADLRTPEEILKDNLMTALPEGGEDFTLMFMVEVIEGVDKIYSADNGKGYVCVIGEEFIGVGEDGVALGDSANKAVAEAAVAIVDATEIEEVTLTDEYKKSFTSITEVGYTVVTKVQKTLSGNYIVDLETDGFGVLGDDSGYISGSGERMKIRVALSSEGKVIDAQTIYHSETETYGGLQLKDGAYNFGFISKTESEVSGAEIVAGCTRTTQAFKQAVLLAFETVTTLEGGATNE